MKPITLLLLFVFVQHLSAQQQDIVKYPIPKKHKVLGTNSIKLNDSTSVHLATIKNKTVKKIVLKPFIITNNKIAKDLNVVTFDEEPQIISAHFVQISIIFFCIS